MVCEFAAASRPLRGFEVEHDALLVAIEAEENRALATDKGRPHPAREVARRRLDFDHVSARVAELHRAERAAESLRKIDDAKAVETSRDCVISTTSPPRSSRIPSSRKHLRGMLARLAARANRTRRRALELPWQPVDMHPAPMRRIDFDDVTIGEDLRMVP